MLSPSSTLGLFAFGREFVIGEELRPAPAKTEILNQAIGDPSQDTNRQSHFRYLMICK